MRQCTLYMTLASSTDLVPLLEQYFPGWGMTVKGSSVTVSKRKFLLKQTIVFTVKSLEADGEDFVAMLRGMHNFFASILTEKEAVKESLLAQIQVFTVTAGVVAARDMDDATFGAVMAVVGEGHGLVFCRPPICSPQRVKWCSTRAASPILIPGQLPPLRPCWTGT